MESVVWGGLWRAGSVLKTRKLSDPGKALPTVTVAIWRRGVQEPKRFRGAGQESSAWHDQWPRNPIGGSHLMANDGQELPP